MPQAVPFIVGAFGFGAGAFTVGSTAFGAWAAGAAFGSTVLGSVLTKLVTTVAISALQAALTDRPGQSGGITIETTLRGEQNPETIILGYTATAGQAICPPYSHGGAHQYLTHVIELCSAPGATLERLIIGDDYVELGETEHPDYGFPVLGEDYEGLIWVKYYDGTQTSADPMMLAKYGDHEDRPWTANMIGEGICYAILTFKFNRSRLSQVPRYRFEMMGIPLYDIRKDSTAGGSGPHRWDDPGTWEQTANNVVIAWNTWRGIALPGGEIWGGGVDVDALPQANWVAQMNKCDDPVPVTAETTEPRYRCGIEAPLSDEPAAVMQEVLKGASAQVADMGGYWRIRCGAPDLPVYALTDDDILVSREQEYDPFPAIGDTYNAVTATYPDPESLWEAKDAPARFNANWETSDAFGRRTAELKLPAVPYPNQVQRLMRAYIEDERRFRRHMFSLPPDALAIELLETVDYSSERNGYDGKDFELAEISEDLLSGIRRVSLREVDPADYDWSPEFQLPNPATPTGTTPVALSVPGFSLVATVVADADGNARRPAIRIGWDTDIRASGVRWEIRRVGQSAADLSGATVDIEAGSITILEGVLPAQGYEGRARLITTGKTSWTGWLSVTTPDVRLGVADLVDDLNARIDTAFDRHDAVLEDATGTVADIRDRVFGLFGAEFFSAVPLAERLELVVGPLDPENPVDPAALPDLPVVSLSDQLGVERARLDFEIPQIRDAGTGLDDIWERLMELRELAFATDKKFADAGIIVDPDAGTVSIRAVEAIAGRQSEVEIKLDAAEALLELTASRTYVDQKVTEALLDPTQLPVVNDLTLRVTDLEISLDAESGRIDLLNETLTVEGALVSMATVTAELDSLGEALTLRVTSEDFDAEVGRINAVEQTLTTLGDVSELRQTVTASRPLAEGLDDLTEASIADLWEMWRKGEAIREASAAGRRELRASVDEQFAAEASERLQLQAEVGGSIALLQQEALTRATELEALGEIVDQIDVGLADLEGETQGLATTLDETRGRVTETEDGLVAEGTRREFLGATVRDLEGLAEEDAEAAIWDLWDRWSADADLRDGIAVRLREAASRVEEGLLAEASERLVLGAALEETRATVVQETRARADGDSALAEQILQLDAQVGTAQAELVELNTVDVTSSSALVQAFLSLEGEVEDAQGEITQLNTVDVGSTSVLVQAHLGLAATVSDPDTGLAAAHGELTQLNTVDVGSTSALVQAHLGLAGTVNDPTTGLAAAHGELTQLNTVDVGSTSALVQAHLGLAATVNDPTTGLAAAHGELTQLNTVDVGSTSALVQAHLGLAATVTDPTTGLAAAHGELTQLNTVDVGSSSALVQAHLGLAGRVGDAEGEISQLNNVDVSSTSALVQAHLGLAGTVNDPTTGLAAAHGELTQLNTVDVGSTSALVQAHLGLAGRVGDAEGEISELNNVDVSSTSALVQSFLTLQGEVTDPATGLTARMTALDGVGGRVELTEDGLESLAGRAEILEASIGAQQVIPNGEFSAGDLRGWANVPAGWSVIQRASTTATAVQAAPRPFLLSIDEDAADSQARAVADIPAAPGERFRATLWGATRVSGTAEAQLRLAWADADGNPLTPTVLAETFTSETWETVDLGLAPAPAGAASLTVEVARAGGGYGKLYLASVRVERESATEADVRARVETIEGAYVDADGAVAAVESTISAEFAGLTAMAQATTFAKATADGIAAGYVWRLNGENVMEAVSVADGTDGPVSTFRLAADYVQITGLTQIDDAVIGELAADNAFIDNLTIGRAQIEDQIQSDNYDPGVAGAMINFATGDAEFNELVVRGEMIVDGAIITDKLSDNAVSEQGYGYTAGPTSLMLTQIDLATLSIDRATGYATKLDFSVQLKGGGGSVTIYIQRQIGAGAWTTLHTADSLGVGYLSFSLRDADTAGGATNYRMRAVQIGETGATAHAATIFATQLKK